MKVKRTVKPKPKLGNPFARKAKALRTGADALALVTPGVKRIDGKDRAPGLKITNVRLRADQIRALQIAAIEIAQERGSGRADMSAILRSLVDNWIGKD